ncbi:hypothetical protein N7495_009156 [Penicillium taxi]|uniref:uncharacterized protein n=1 Tax=Penicillium taxi TaxID=168475 RepID=UPI002545A96C|nr:uncharacterized protein N7495_009156 [Penicillium taxi]KAJ5884646.1 hypothetical protein N7495_009156 [Penicillium taxi]
MAEAPPIIFIARHGARLDAADKSWHLTSPTPYNPPLSYGGWLQSRALGVRIASLLRAPEYSGRGSESEHDQSQTPDVPANVQPKSIPAFSDLCNRYNVIIHTSPYLRCLQTAIGVSTGLSQHLSGAEPLEPSDQTGSPSASDVALPQLKTLLRVDAFLGEWLSPDYFELITPPPNSDRMVALAKAELLRRGETIPASATTGEGARTISGHFPGGWGTQSNQNSLNEEKDDHPLFSPDSSKVLGNQRQRASSYTIQVQSPISRTPNTLGPLKTDLPPVVDAAYVPPTPGYAVSPLDPIPSGYVSHARDACTKIDYQWDSMRSPFWGTGGEFGEEWGKMHERVDNGFRQMIDWYRKPVPTTPSDLEAVVDDTKATKRLAQTIIIIITHGADCNALISSLSDRSVLLDIGTASLTMAVRRDRLKSIISDSDKMSGSRETQKNPTVSQEYVLQLIASTDHLRLGVNPSQLLSLSSASGSRPPPVPAIPYYRNRLSSRASPQTTGPISGSGNGPSNWSISPRSSTSTVPPRSAGGLWGSLSSPIEQDDDEDDDFVPNFGGHPVNHHDRAFSTGAADRPGWTKKLPQRTPSQRGLWGANSSSSHDAHSRRRWTLTEQKI